MARAVATALFALVTAGSALAAAPVVPQTQLVQMKSILGQIGASDLAILPTRVPPHYAFESYSVTGSPPGINVSMTDQRHIASRTEAIRYEISYDTAYHAGRCADGRRKTLRVGGVRVFSDGTTVWRCVKGSRGRLVKASAHGRLGQKALAALVASAR